MAALLMSPQLLLGAPQSSGSESFAAEWYLPLRARALADLEAEFYAHTVAAEEARMRETAAATLLESCWRAHAWLGKLKGMNAQALLIQRGIRGFLHRQEARRVRRARDLRRQRQVFEACATTLQVSSHGLDRVWLGI